MEIIYLAAGRGSRLKKQTAQIPKCLVKVNGKPIIEYNNIFLNRFNKINIVVGYKKDKRIKRYKNKKFNFVENKNYKNSNMVESAFLVKPKLDNIVICYGDIIFDNKIFSLLNEGKNNILLAKEDWLKIWKMRMSKTNILSDAESFQKNKNDYLVSIGEKIKKFPRYQYMGLIKLKKKDFVKLRKFYKKLDKKIDFTSFINLSLKEKIIKLKVITTKKFWIEIDSEKDLKLAEKLVKKL